MKTSRRSFPWTIIATAAVAGASFVGIASYVNGNRTQALPSEDVPIAVQDVTPKTDSVANKPTRNDDGGSGDASQLVERVTSTDLNRAVKNAGFENARVLGLDLDGTTAIVDMNSAIIDSLGSTGEAELIEALKAALKKDKRVKAFQIRIDGEIQKTLGHSDLSSPVLVR
jgi:hypothetical protein